MTLFHFCQRNSANLFPSAEAIFMSNIVATSVQFRQANKQEISSLLTLNILKIDIPGVC